MRQKPRKTRRNSRFLARRFLAIDPHELLRIEVETLFTLDARGRIAHENDPDESPGPRAYVCDGITYLRHDVETMPDEEGEPGLTFVVPDDFTFRSDIDVIASGSPDEARVEMTEEWQALGYKPGELWGPWCAAFIDGEVACIAETVRRGPRGVEAGVRTLERFRRRGAAVAATAGWAQHPALAKLVRFYSCDERNAASRAVAAKLGLCFVGASTRVG